MDAVDQGVEVAAGQVRAADAVVKQYVTAYYHAGFGVIEYDVARCVAGSEQYFELLVAKNNLLSFVEIAIGFGRFVTNKAIVGRICRHGPQHRFVLLVDV